MAGRFLIYGAYGYTGAAIAERSVARGHAPVLAGRDPGRLAPIARRLDLPARTLALDDRTALVAALRDVDAVVHAAGPFSATADPMISACLAASVHYLDVTGEIDVFEDVLGRNEAACRRGVTLVPGVGFDVVPTDCLARALADALPEAHALDLAIHTRGRASRGTRRTIVEGLPRGGRARIGGRIVGVPLGWRTRDVPFPDRTRPAVSIPWGDVSTAWHTTGIPDVTVFAAASHGTIRWLRRIERFRFALRWPAVRLVLDAWANRGPTGARTDDRAAGSTQAWGEARAPDGRSVAGWVRGPDGYALTADAAVRAVERVLAGVGAGAMTPARAFGAAFVRELDGVETGGSGP